MFTKKSELKDLIPVLKEKNACQEALNAIEKYKIIEDYVNSKEFSHSWSVWGFTNLYDIFDEELRLLLLEKIPDPMMNLSLRADSVNLTLNEKTALESVYKGKLPNAEKEVSSGKITFKCVETK